MILYMYRVSYIAIDTDDSNGEDFSYAFFTVKDDAERFKNDLMKKQKKYRAVSLNRWQWRVEAGA